MALRKASAYSKKPVLAFTRISKQKKKAFIKVVPPQKIVKFSMGNQQGFDAGKMPFRLTVVSVENCQIRHNALEAYRQFVNKPLEGKYLGQYFFRVLPYPHHIQRENKMLTGAGADRMSTGMQLSFGKSSGKAAILKKGSKIFFVAAQSEKIIREARKLMEQAKSKLPCRTRNISEIVKTDTSFK
ncbi:50S ribosomal protein L16 [Candidatus Pacearchaeota archaeon]|nr:50S ribosomal protein L16 [Candidatus Pacearchaeota archaeon]